MIGKDININGPYNITRLEGDINGVHKVIYLFFDIHRFDYECDDMDAIDVSKYILKVFRKAKTALPEITYDFFVETFTRPEKSEYDKVVRDNYLQYVRKLFYNLRKNDRILTTEMSVRLHYTDFRDFLGLFEMLDQLRYPINVIDTMWASMFVSQQNLENIVKSCESFSDNVRYIGHLLTKKIEKINIKNKSKFFDANKTISKKDSSELLNNFFYKMRYSYKNKNIQQKLTSIMDEMYNKTVDLYNDINDFIKFVNSKKHMFDGPYPGSDHDVTLIPKLVSEIKQKLLLLKEDLFMITTLTIDIFMIRRFLDKEYITNSIYYSGGSHSMNIMIILTKYFDFKVTHISKSPISVKELTTTLKQTDIFSRTRINKIIKVDYQCSSLSGFPDLLT